MIDTGTSFFMCDECPACEGVDYRLRIAKEGGYDPQLEYCWCEKLQSKFLFSGYCEDAISQKPKAIKKGKRKTGMAYRREMKQKHDKDLAWIIHNCGYNPAVGFIDWDWVDGVWQPVGKYIKYPKTQMRSSIGNVIPIRSCERRRKYSVEISIGSVSITGGHCTKGGQYGKVYPL